MPTVCVRVPAETFDQGAKDLLASGITDACARAEGIPDDPARRIGSWVLIDEVAEGCWFAGGARDALAAFVPIVVQVYPPAGVLDADRREILVRGISSAVARRSRTRNEKPRPPSSYSKCRRAIGGCEKRSSA